MQTLIKEYYLKEYPNDDIGKNINSKITFYDLFDCLDWNKDIYKIIGIGDSLVRERLFSKLANLINTDYDYIYNQWLNI